MTRASIALAVIAVVVALLIPAQASAWYWRCGDTNFISDIAVKNMYCKTAKRYIRNWYRHGQPMPSSFTCRLQSGAKSRCVNGRKAFSFRFAE